MVLNCIQTAEKCIAPEDDEQKNQTDYEPGKFDKTVEEKIDYDPYHYGKEVHPTIFWGPVFHLLKTVVGSGILALPYTFKSVGYTIAISGTLVIGFLYVHVLQMLLEIEYELCKRMKIPNLTYVGVVQHSFEQGPKIFRKCTSVAKFMVYFHYVVNKAMSNAIYLITIGTNFKIIIDHYYGTDLKIVNIMTILIIPLILLCSIRNLKFLVPLSMLTNVFNMVNVVLIIAISTNYDGSADLKPVNDIAEFPNFFGIVLGALHCTGIMLPLKNDMKNPEKFSTSFGVLNITLTVSTVLYCIFGFLGYSKYGEQLQPNILFNLPPGRLISLLVLALYSFALCVSFTLFVYIGFDTIWANLFKDRKIKFPLTTEYGIRIAVCLLPYFMAVALPDFKIMVTLGGVVGILMDEAFPPILHLLLLQKTKKRCMRTYFIILKDIGLILISFFLFTAGFISVVNSIVEFYNKI